MRFDKHRIRFFDLSDSHFQSGANGSDIYLFQSHRCNTCTSTNFHKETHLHKLAVSRAGQLQLCQKQNQRFTLGIQKREIW